MSPLSYQWRFDGTNLVDAGNLSGALTSTLTISNVQLTDQGAYSVIVTNTYGSVGSSNAMLTVLPGTSQTNSFLSGMLFTNGIFRMQLNGLSAHGPVVVYGSTNLIEWESIFTNPPTEGIMEFLDVYATNWPVRFYRVLER